MRVERGSLLAGATVSSARSGERQKRTDQLTRSRAHSSGCMLVEARRRPQRCSVSCMRAAMARRAPIHSGRLQSSLPPSAHLPLARRTDAVCDMRTAQPPSLSLCSSSISSMRMDVCGFDRPSGVDDGSRDSRAPSTARGSHLPGERSALAESAAHSRITVAVG